VESIPGIHPHVAEVPMKCRTAVAALAVAVLAGCDDTPTQFVCEANPSPAVAVFVVEPVEERSVASEARGWYRVGTRQDSLRHRSTPEGEHLAAFGAGGVYDIEIHVAGHAPWRARSVVVPEGICGPLTVRVHATLAPLP
jgi:hypothetical protein